MSGIEQQSVSITVAPGYLSKQFIAGQEGHWIATEGRTYADGCSDDRAVTLDSADQITQELPEETIPLDEGYASTFGGAIGQADGLLVAGVATHGPDFIEAIDGLPGALDEVKAVRGDFAMLHSAELNEGRAGSFCPHSDKPIGCAFCMGVGAVSYYLAPDSSKPEAEQQAIALIEQVGREDQARLFGNDDPVDSFIAARKILSQHFSGIAQIRNGEQADARSFQIDRKRFAGLQELGNHIMVLAGNHAPAAETGVISSFDLKSIGSANSAAEAGTPVYRQDLAVTAENLGSVLKEYRIPASTFVRAMQYTSTVVRAVLVSNDQDPNLQGQLDPRPLAIGHRGDPQEALAYLDRQLRFDWSF